MSERLTDLAQVTFDIVRSALEASGAQILTGAGARDFDVVERDGLLTFAAPETNRLSATGMRLAATGVRLGNTRPASGFTHARGAELSTWTRLGSVLEMTLPEDRRARLLVLLHGEISTTIGTFGSLTLTPWGRRLLQAWDERYDAVLGFDHDSVRVDPLANARDLLDRLAELSVPPAIEVIAHGRGGLVLRGLTVLLGETSAGPELHAGTLIASPNAGTPLAARGHEMELARILANLTGATVSALSPARVDAATVGASSLADLGGLLSGGIGRPVPGLEAMDVESDFLAELAARSSPKRRFGGAVLTAVTGAFTARRGRLASRPVLGGLVSEALKGNPSDLVVPLASMSALEALSDIYSLGRTPVAHHLAYLTRPDVVAALRRWHQAATPVAVEPGTIVQADLPAQVYDRISIVDAGETVEAAIERIAAETPDYVILEDPEAGGYTTLPAETAVAEIEARTRDASGAEPQPGAPVPDGGVGPPVFDAGFAYEPAPAPISENEAVTAEPSAEPVVVFSRGEPVGVVAPQPAAALEDLLNVPTEGVEPAGPIGVAPVRPASADRLLVHAQAQIERVLVLRRTATVYVDLAREAQAPAPGGVLGQQRAAEFDARPIIVEVRPIDKLEVSGPCRLQVNPPTPQEPVSLSFDVVAVAVGEAELWVIVRQGVLPAITFRLMPSVIEESAVESVPTVAAVSASAPADVDRCPVRHLLEIYDYGDAKLRFSITPDPSGVFRDYVQDIPERAEREKYVKGLYAQIEERYASAGGDAEGFQESLQEFGDELARELLPEDLQQVLWDHREALEGLFVVSLEPFIPWELVHLKQPGKPLSAEPCFLGQLGAVRWLHGQRHPPCTLTVRKARSRYIIPRYADPKLRLVATDAEREFLQSRFAAEPVKPELATVKEFLKRPAPADLIHFAGHGFGQDGDFSTAALLLQGRPQRQAGATVYTRELLDTRFVKSWMQLEGEDGEQPIVVLNACQSGRLEQRLTSIGGFAEAFVSVGAGAFVASLWSVGDEPAATFTSALYDHLLAGLRMAQAVRQARAAARASGDGTWLAYTVYAHPAAVLRRD